MQLVFLWMDTEKQIIHDINLQLSPQHPCYFEKNRKILKRCKTEHSFNIFSEYSKPISNISVLVGENGSGKTTIMKEMFEVLRKGSDSVQYLALYYGKLETGSDCSECYYFWTNLRNNAQEKDDMPFKPKGFGGVPLRKLLREDVEDEFYFIRYTDVLSLHEYAKRDLLPTRNSCDLTMVSRLMDPGNKEIKPAYISVQDPILQLYHAETELQIQALKEDIPFPIKKIDILPCPSIDSQSMEVLAAKDSMIWKTIDEAGSLAPKEKAVNCVEI